ncbi:MAG: transposase [Phreatobacter sp.]|nr:transposase [Phreatobacter sp.]
MDFSCPGKAPYNTFSGAFNRQFKAECLHTKWFLMLVDTAKKLVAWRR